MKLKKIIVIICSVVLLSACETSGQGNNIFSKENIGAVAGAVGGAALGSSIGKGKGNVAAIAAGTLLGAGLGKSIGRSLDRADLNQYHQTSQYSLENAKTGTTSSWVNPDSGNSGSITPTKTFQNAQGRNCREYTQTITIGGKNEQAYGTACRQPDGSWQIIE